MNIDNSRTRTKNTDRFRNIVTVCQDAKTLYRAWLMSRCGFDRDVQRECRSKDINRAEVELICRRRQ